MKHAFVRTVGGLAIAIMAAVATLSAAPLTMVSVGAPAINFVISPSRTVTVTDTTATIPLAQAVGTAFLQTRTFKSDPASPAAGRYVYEYRIDLRQASSVTAVPCISSLAIDAGPPSALDYNTDGISTDRVFVVTSGGLGSVGPSAASQAGNTLTFVFSSLVCAGDSSYFFGFTSKKAPVSTTATLKDINGPIYSVAARAPSLTLIPIINGGWSGLLVSKMTPDARTALQWNITDQRQRRFMGTMTVSDATLFVEGTIAASGHVTVIGGGRDGSFMLEGQYDAVDDQGTIVGRYRLKLADGTVDEGTAQLSQTSGP